MVVKKERAGYRERERTRDPKKAIKRENDDAFALLYSRLKKMEIKIYLISLITD